MNSRQAFHRASLVVLAATAVPALLLLGHLSALGQVSPAGVTPASESAAGSLPPEAAQPYNEGLELANQGDFAQARARFEEATAAAPDYAPAHYNLGLVLKSMGSFSEASASFRKVLEIDPENSLAQRFLAETLMAGGSYAEALPELEKAIAADSTRAALYYARAQAVQALNPDQQDRVSEAWESALRNGPREPGAYAAASNLARIYLAQEKLDQAAAAYETAIRIQPDNAEPYYNKAVVLNKKGDYKGAIPLLEKAIQLKSPNGMASNLLAGIYYQHIQDDGKALEYYEKAAADPGYAKADQAAKSAASIREYIKKKEEQRREELEGN